MSHALMYSSYCVESMDTVAKNWYVHVSSRTSAEIGKATLFWVYDFQTDRLIRHRLPDIIEQDKHISSKKNSCL